MCDDSFLIIMACLQIILLAASASLVLGQRPFFAGSRPIGYPEIEKPSTTADELGNRFGEGTTQRLPVEALGDRDLVDRLSKLPIDKQPFWFINWQAIEAHRQQPQTYPLRPNPFAESASVNAPAPSGNPPTSSDLGNRSGVSANPTSAPSPTNAPLYKQSDNRVKESVHSVSKTNGGKGPNAQN
ncbi:unnamed protein product, partial [Iphiclides podalirius]